jgi:putative ABC transport system permease protein
MGKPVIKNSDIFKLAAQSLGANKLRSSLTMMGIAIGVFSVVGVMTALSAVRDSIDSGLSFLGANVMQVSIQPPVQLGGIHSDRSWRRRPPITPRQAQDFARLMEMEGLPTTLFGNDNGKRVRYGEKMTSPRIQVVGTNENYLLTHKFDIAYGRNLNALDIEFNRPVAVIGFEIEDELFPNEDPLDKTIVIDGQKFVVVGVLEERGALFGNSLDNRALIPVTRFVANYWSRWRSMGLSVQAPSTAAMEATQDMVVGHFRLIRGLEPGQQNNFEIFSNDSMQEAFEEIAVTVGTGGLFISAIALLCSGIGIMNIMLVSVTERTREIGLRKSIGARRKDILFQFLLEAIFLSLIGGFFGIILGIGGGNLVATQLGVPMIFAWNWIITAILVCSAIGIAFGFLPALRAARLKPIDALRYE